MEKAPIPRPMSPQHKGWYTTILTPSDELKGAWPLFFSTGYLNYAFSCSLQEGQWSMLEVWGTGWVNSVFSAGMGCLEALQDVPGLGSLNQTTRVPATLPDPTGAEGSS